MEFIGELLLRPRGPLEDLAQRIGERLGLSFSKDTSGRFEEFPAYTADVLGMEVAVLGIPERDEQDPRDPVEYFSLLVTPFHSDSSDDGEIDLSSYIKSLLESAGIACRAPDWTTVPTPNGSGRGKPD